jgi:hypothetical protein
MKTNKEKVTQLLSKQGFHFDERVDTREHSLEVQLPFLYYINPDIKLIPIIFCKQNLENAKILSKNIQEIIDDDTLLIISTDLSHFHNASRAEVIDNNLIELFTKNDINGLYDSLANRRCEACGFGGLLTLMYLIQSMSNVCIDHLYYTHSGKVSGDNSGVVGYFSCGVYV